MKPHFYSSERNVQIVISLLKSHGIKKVVTSPGMTNITFVASIQTDPFFELYSCVDERSAAYMACGMAAETGEPIVLSCTGATASRNYMPALTEAFYRKLPILAITSSRAENLIGHLKPQLTNRYVIPADIVTEHVTAPFVTDEHSELLCILEVNKAILALKHHEGGPAHINLLTFSTPNFSVQKLPPVRAIYRTEFGDEFPQMPKGRKVIFIGSHRPMSKNLTSLIEKFCEVHDAIVLIDQTSGYYGKYRIQSALQMFQLENSGPIPNMDLLIHIGEVSGDYEVLRFRPKQVWRVSPDGAVRDYFKALTRVFEMPLDYFFEFYSKGEHKKTEQYEEIKSYDDLLRLNLPDLPFSNIWVASQLSGKLPQHSVIHFGILDSLRSWNFFECPPSVQGYSNVGGFGIDGCLSSAVGGSIVYPENIHYCVLGDLAFFYDMNALGNRHIENNLRVLLINNGLGQEFRNGAVDRCYGLKDAMNPFVAAEGHYGQKSPSLLRHFSQDLGFEYHAASNKEEFIAVMDWFLSPSITEKPIFLEVFTDSMFEQRALDMMNHVWHNNLSIFKTAVTKIRQEVKSEIVDVIGEEKIKAIKTLLS